MSLLKDPAGMHPDILAPVPDDEVFADPSPEVEPVPEQPARARLGATRRVMRAEILLDAVFGMLMRFSLRSSRRTSTHLCSADLCGESRHCPSAASRPG